MDEDGDNGPVCPFGISGFVYGQGGFFLAMSTAWWWEGRFVFAGKVSSFFFLLFVFFFSGGVKFLV